MALTYIGTRDRSIKATASEAILRGICPDGGLYIPEEIPKMEKSLEELGRLDYQELAYEVLSKFLDFTEEELKAMHCFWNYSTGEHWHLRIWHFPYCPI